MPRMSDVRLVGKREGLKKGRAERREGGRKKKGWEGGRKEGRKEGRKILYLYSRNRPKFNP